MPTSPGDPRRRMLPVMAMALFIDSMGIGIVLPVAPKLVMELTGLPRYVLTRGHLSIHDGKVDVPVSYTHLTLPTIYSV